MVKVVSLSFEKCFGPFTCYFSKRNPERDYLDIYITIYISYQFHLLFEMFKIESKFRKWKKNIENIFCF